MKRPLLVFAASLCLGLLLNLAVGHRTLQGDEPDYDALARHFAQSGEFGWPGHQAARAPLYPMLLGMVYRGFGPGEASGRVLSSILGAFVMSLTFLIGRRLAGDGAGFLAVVFLLCDSHWWHNQVLLMQENLLGVWIGVTIFGALSLIVLNVGGPGSAGPNVIGPGTIGPKPGTPGGTGPKADAPVRNELKSHASNRRPLKLGGRESGIVGLALGLSLLTKPLLAPLCLLLCLVPIFTPRVHRRTAALSVAIVLALTVATVLPWALRNQRVLGRVLPLGTGSGMIFAGAHAGGNEGFNGGWSRTGRFLSPSQEDSLRKLPPARAELSRDRMEWSNGWREIRTRSPVMLARHLVLKILRFWSPSTFFGANGIWLLTLKVLLTFVQLIILLEFLFSLRDRPLHPWLPALLIASALVTIVIFWGSSRFRYPLAPVICAYAAAGMRGEVRANAALVPVLRTLRHLRFLR